MAVKGLSRILGPPIPIYCKPNSRLHGFGLAEVFKGEPYFQILEIIGRAFCRLKETDYVYKRTAEEVNVYYITWCGDRGERIITSKAVVPWVADNKQEEV